MVVVGFALLAHAEDAGSKPELPFRRLFDVSIGFPGVPDVVGARIELWVTRHLSIEGGASTALYASFLTASLNHRWNLRVTERSTGVYDAWMLGPAIGVRRASYTCFDVCQDPSVYADGLASLQFDHWFRRHLGVQIQLDAGLTVHLGRIARGEAQFDVVPVLPNARLGLGMAF